MLPSSRPKYSVPVNTELTGMGMCFDYTGSLQGMRPSINNGRGKKIDPELQRRYQNGPDSFKNRDNCFMLFCSTCVNLNQCTVSGFTKLQFHLRALKLENTGVKVFNCLTRTRWKKSARFDWKFRRIDFTLKIFIVHK
jgi:hypothetical protein